MQVKWSVEVSNLLVELQSLVSSTANEAGVSSEEKDANQLQIDSILQTIDRIANATSFQGEKLLKRLWIRKVPSRVAHEVCRAHQQAYCCGLSRLTYLVFNITGPTLT